MKIISERNKIRNISPTINLYNVTPLLEDHILSVFHGRIENPDIVNYISRPLPTGYIVMFLHFASPLVLYDKKMSNPRRLNSFITGIHTLEHHTYLEATGIVDNLVVTFKPGGFASIFGIHASEIMNKVIDIEQLIKKEDICHFENIFACNNLTEKVDALLIFLTNLYNQNKFATQLNHHEAINLIHEKKGNINLNQLSTILDVSPRTIERSFLVNVGVHPKEFIRIVRFNTMFGWLQNNMYNDWQEIVHLLGYYDQSHFIREFKSITGYSPGEFIKFQEHGLVFLDRFQVVYHKNQH